ncbi:MAG: GIY-YIG nuclease family protein [Crenarchaeota archaeon]|nr:GIY-YIG nuclease family protein [Thermoproteota archaeon]
MLSSVNKWFIYAIECENDSLYIGQTSNLQKRWEMHLLGKGADWTKKYKPTYFYEIETCDSLKEAILKEKDWKTTNGRRKIKQIVANLRDSQAGEPAEKLLERILAEKERLSHGTQRTLRKKI